MTPQQFIAKWKQANLSERSAAQSHFIDLCRLLNEPEPTDADQEGTHYTFERGVSKTDGGDGFSSSRSAGTHIDNRPAAGTCTRDSSSRSPCRKTSIS